jgi:hypothetical protein
MRTRSRPTSVNTMSSGGFILADPFETILRSLSVSYLHDAWERVASTLAHFQLAPADLSLGWLHPGATFPAGLERRFRPSDYVGWTSHDLALFYQDSRYESIDAELAHGQPVLRCATSYRSLKWNITPDDYSLGLQVIEALATDEVSDWAPAWMLEHAEGASGAWVEIA